MTDHRVVFYVSGHGFGHAIRSTEIIKALSRRIGTGSIFVRTRAPKEILSGAVSDLRRVEAVDTDPGVVEDNGPLSICPQRTAEKIAQFQQGADRLIARELRFLKQLNPTLLVADIPYLVGDLAEALDAASIGIANFTWDWIYEPLLSDQQQQRLLLDPIRSAYRKMQTYLRLPFSHDVDMFPELIDLPLVARHSVRSESDILGQLGIPPSDRRKRVLVAMRGRLPETAIVKGAHQAEDHLLLVLGSGPASASGNLRYVELDGNLNFSDLLRVCDIAVCKLGYGVVADCLANGTAILFPPRRRFREDVILRPAAEKHACAVEIPLEHFQAGDWGDYLRRMDGATIHYDAASNGADVAAELIASRL